MIALRVGSRVLPVPDGSVVEIRADGDDGFTVTIRGDRHSGGQRHVGSERVGPDSLRSEPVRFEIDFLTSEEEARLLQR